MTQIEKHFTGQTTSQLRRWAIDPPPCGTYVLADMLSMYVDGEHKMWDEALPFVTFDYNVSKQESTGFSPFYLVNCGEGILPIDAKLATNPNAVVENCASPEYADCALRTAK